MAHLKIGIDSPTLTFKEIKKIQFNHSILISFAQINGKRSDLIYR